MKSATANKAQALMVGLEGVHPVLTGMKVEGVVLEALSEFTVVQAYRNNDAKNIEAVYTFPLPLDAVLLDLKIRLGDKEYQGQVAPRSAAEKSYEKAIHDGDSAIMLENPQPGLYTMNVGNLLPGEECVITFRYGMFHHWVGDTLRVCLPTIVAPRYGDPAAGNLQPHQVPVTDLLAEHSLSLRLKVQGALAGAKISSPSHQNQLQASQGSMTTTVELAKGATLDRDFILEFTATGELPVRGYYARDGKRTLTWVPFHPVFSQTAERQPLAVTVVVDCSGSMRGDSMHQAREALLRIIETLRPEDYFGVIAFGNQQKLYADRLLPADELKLAGAKRFIEELDANMGGTELGAAMRVAYRLDAPEALSQCVLLITDGQDNAWKTVANEAKKSGRLVFTVGVGSSVTEAAVRGIADRTGAACELVSPNEDMAGRIHRHFLRMREARSQQFAINWPEPAKALWPETVGSIYSGDTLHQCAWFDGTPDGAARLTVILPEGGAVVQEARLEPCPEAIDEGTLPRLVAGYKLRGNLTDKQGERLAMEYRLVSPWTNYCAVIARKGQEVSKELPELRQVRQMFPAGGHGVGSVLHSFVASDAPAFMRMCKSSAPTKASMDLSDVSAEKMLCHREDVRAMASCVEPPPPGDVPFPAFIEVLRRDTLDIGDILHTLPNEVRNGLLQLARSGLREKEIVIIFLKRLIEQLDPVHYSRQLARRVEVAYHQILIPYEAFEFNRKEVEYPVRDLVEKVMKIMARP